MVGQSDFFTVKVRLTQLGKSVSEIVKIFVMLSIDVLSDRCMLVSSCDQFTRIGKS